MKKAFKQVGSRIVKCKNPTEIMEIPTKRKLTEIDANVFMGNKILERISIPGNIRILNVSAFEGCKILKTVSFAPAAMVILKSNVFKKCKHLSAVENMNVIISMDKQAFKDCAELEEVEINPYLIEFGKGCFEGCKKISHVTLPLLHTVVPERAFYDCEHLMAVNMGPAVEVVDKKAFFGCTALTDIEFSNTLDNISKSAFESCYSLERVVIEKGIKKISSDAFKECRSLSVVKCGALAENVKQKSVICANAFAGCYELRTLELSGNRWKISASAFKDCHLSPESRLVVVVDTEEVAKNIERQLSSLMKKDLLRVVVAGMDLNEEPKVITNADNANDDANSTNDHPDEIDSSDEIAVSDDTNK